MNYKLTYIYTLGDLIKIPFSLSDFLSGSKDFYDLYQTITDLTDSEIDKTEINNVFKIVFSRILDHDLIESDHEITTTAELKNETSFVYMILRFGQWLKTTYPKYKELISAYTTKSGHLLDKVETETIARGWFNDTPQSENLNASSEDLTHLSTFNKDHNVSGSDLSSPIQRIAEIQESYTPIYKEWADSFIMAFNLESKR